MGRVRSKETKPKPKGSEQNKNKLKNNWVCSGRAISWSGSAQLVWLSLISLKLSNFSQLELSWCRRESNKNKRPGVRWLVFSFQNISEKRSRCKNLKTLENWSHLKRFESNVTPQRYSKIEKSDDGFYWRLQIFSSTVEFPNRYVSFFNAKLSSFDDFIHFCVLHNQLCLLSGPLMNHLEKKNKMFLISLLLLKNRRLNLEVNFMFS